MKNKIISIAASLALLCGFGINHSNASGPSTQELFLFNQAPKTPPPPYFSYTKKFLVLIEQQINKMRSNDTEGLISLERIMNEKDEIFETFFPDDEDKSFEVDFSNINPFNDKSNRSLLNGISSAVEMRINRFVDLHLGGFRDLSTVTAGECFHEAIGIALKLYSQNYPYEGICVGRGNYYLKELEEYRKNVVYPQEAEYEVITPIIFLPERPKNGNPDMRVYSSIVLVPGVGYYIKHELIEKTYLGCNITHGYVELAEWKGYGYTNNYDDLANIN